MPNTANHQLPYPDDEEWLNNGAAAMQTLAERLDTILASLDAVTIARAEHAGVAGGVVDFPGAQSLANFTYDAGVLTFTGPAARLFLVDVEVEVEAGAGAGVPNVDSVVEVRVNGSAIAGSHDQIALTSGAIQARRFSHRVTVPVLLGPGQTLDVLASSSPVGGALGVCGLRVYPIGPRT